MKNYYAILEIKFPSKQDEIRGAYRVLAKKWHPDLNQSSNATEKMQDLTEAYYILSNLRAKELYDENYLKQNTKEEVLEKRPKKHSENFSEQTNCNSFETGVGEELKEWIRKARIKSKEFVYNSIQTTKGATSLGAKTAGKAFLIGVAFIILIILIGLIARIFN